MKLLGVFFILIISISLASAACYIDVVLVNQDPYPAMPGEYVKIIFQVSGIEAADCGRVEFWIEEDFPFSLDPEVENKVTIRSGSYVQDYKKFFLVPYRLRVHEDALDGENQLTVTYSSTWGKVFFSEDFNITIEDSRTDFEVHIKDYTPSTKKVVFEILNIGENNVEGLTIEIPKQENVKIQGTNRIIIGDLNSNEEDSATFEADLDEGYINLDIIYTDQIGERRVLEKTVYFDPAPFKEVEQKSQPISPTVAFIIGILIPLIILYIRGKLKKRRERKERLKKRSRL